MATLTIKIDERNSMAKAFINYVKTLPFIKIEKDDTQPHYNPEFVKMIRESEKQIERGETTTVDPDNLWESLGLK